MRWARSRRRGRCGTGSCSWRSCCSSRRGSPACFRAVVFVPRRRSRRRQATEMATLEARGLHMRFGDRVVLEDISLVFPDREFTGIMGPNGAGKTTSFNVLTGRYRPTRGHVFLNGEDITGLAPRTIARKGVARSFQTINLFNDFSALDNVALAVPENRARGFALLGKARHDSTVSDRAH